MNSVDGIAIGSAYRDGITGAEGTCTGLCVYISGCNQALIVPHGLSSGPDLAPGRDY